MDHISGQTHLACLIISHLLISTHVDGEVSVICPAQPVFIHPGEDATLSCHLEPEFNLENMTVVWTKLNQVVGGSKNEEQPQSHLHVHQHDGTFPQKDVSHNKGRTSLCVDELRNGNVLLKLSRVTPLDTGRYRLFIPGLNSQVNNAVVELVVEESINTTAESGMTDQGQNNETHFEGEVAYTRITGLADINNPWNQLLLCCVLLVMLGAVIYSIYQCCCQKTPVSEPPPTYALLQLQHVLQLSETQPQPVRNSIEDPVSLYCNKNGLFDYRGPDLPGPAPSTS